MKKSIFSLGVTMFMTLFVFTATSQVEGAEISFTKEIHDYGTIQQGANGECFFEFKNTGTEPLVISNAQGSCGCTVPEWPKEPIAPGQTGKIKVSYDTKRIGMINKSVKIMSNARNVSIVELRITGNVLADEAPAPEK